MSGQAPYAVFFKITGFDSPKSVNLEYKVLDATSTDMLVSPGWLDYVSGSYSMGFENYTAIPDPGVDASDKFRAEIFVHMRSVLSGLVPGVPGTDLYFFWVP